MTIQQQFEAGVSHHRAGRSAEAEIIYRQVLAQQPNHVDALHRLAMLAARAGRSDEAVQLMRETVRLKPDWAEAHGNLGNVFKDSGRLEEAVAAYRQAIRLKPDLAGAHSNLGNALESLGKFDEAIASYRRAIQLKPDLAAAHTNLGNVLCKLGRFDEAIASVRQAIRLKPDLAEAYNNLGSVLTKMGQLDEAVTAYRHAISIKPDYSDAHFNLGTALQCKGRLDEASASFLEAIRLKPDYPDAHNNLGIVLGSLERFEEAVNSFRQVIRLKPDYAEAHGNLANALKDRGQIDEAITSHRQAIRLRPDYAEAHNNLGNALSILKQFDEAVASFGEAIRLKPLYAEAHNNLANALKELGRPDEAVASYRQAIQLKPDYAEAHSNLGNALAEIGKLNEAIASHRQAVRVKPDCAKTHSNLVFTVQYHPGYDGKMIRKELDRWNQQHAEPLKKAIQPHTNRRDSDRRLRIGYVSPDFREHVVGQNLLPLLRERDHRQTEIFCYADLLRPDPRTDQLRRHADVWRGIVGITDSKVAALIRQDGIDVLVDLALHTANNRLAMFARKPAPVQVTYLGYCGSTGLEAMDYRLSDPYLDPSDSDLSFYSERTIRLPETYWCYANAEPTFEPSPPPAPTAGFITFGCLNNFAKVSPALELWAEVLRSVPRSRLIVHSLPGTHLDAIRDRFAGNGVSPDRLEFVGRQPWPEYARTYGRIDIALDPFPWGGGITTCDALWMGVPVVSLVGRTAVGRGGNSILHNVGVPELVAKTPQQYVQIAAALAEDLPRLVDLRRTLRPRMLASPLMDAPRFARNVEAAYRQMWREWCAAVT